MINNIFAHWKTTIAGIIAIILGIAFLMGRINLNEFISSVVFVLGGGLMLSADAGKPSGPPPVA